MVDAQSKQSMVTSVGVYMVAPIFARRGSLGHAVERQTSGSHLRASDVTAIGQGEQGPETLTRRTHSNNPTICNPTESNDHSYVPLIPI